jgi:hypothetical protein
MQHLTDTQLHERARKRVEFRAHLVAFCIINGALWLIWYLTSARYPWPMWPTIGWGIGLIFHFIFEYKPAKFLSEEEEYKKLKRRENN